MTAWRGHLERVGDGYAGELRRGDLDWPLLLTAVVEEVDGKRRFAITGTMGEPPAWLRVPLLDDPPGPRR